eukprot:TRINITY_DN112810_c0_g1_i1.p1 TRINITY_DN112810_c0_g1~~TRINITY_DN112810_c0_g1_i1.p1  ORF type:complete len:461 (+),score=90.29 TRINITY_DN112810_c0_g1_i1:138-1385(+)
MVSQHPLFGLSQEQRAALLAYFREQEGKGNLKISCSRFQDGKLLVVNYTESYNEKTAPADWDWRMEVARGCVLFVAAGADESDGATSPEVVALAMPKFHGYDKDPAALACIDANGALRCMRKFDGSCVTIAQFRGEVLLFTRGVRENLQTQLASKLLPESARTALAARLVEGASTVAVELIHDKDSKVEANRGRNRLVVLYATDEAGCIVPSSLLPALAKELGFTEADECVATIEMTGSELLAEMQKLNEATKLEDLREGFVVEIEDNDGGLHGVGFRVNKYKVKPGLYKAAASRTAFPQPTQAWFEKLWTRCKTIDAVEAEVQGMEEKGPMDYGSLARKLLDDHMQRVQDELKRLQSLHKDFATVKDLGAASTVAKGDKPVLFKCLNLPPAERDIWFDGSEARFLVAKRLASSK